MAAMGSSPQLIASTGKRSLSSSPLIENNDSAEIIIPDISATTWGIGSLIMGINLYFLGTHLISLLANSKLKVAWKVFCGIYVFSGMLVYLAGIGYLVVRKNKDASHLIVLTTPECREIGDGSSNVRRADIVSMQLLQNRAGANVERSCLGLFNNLVKLGLL